MKMLLCGAETQELAVMGWRGTRASGDGSSLFSFSGSERALLVRRVAPVDGDFCFVFPLARIELQASPLLFVFPGGCEWFLLSLRVGCAGRGEIDVAARSES